MGLLFRNVNEIFRVKFMEVPAFFDTNINETTGEEEIIITETSSYSFEWYPLQQVDLSVRDEQTIEEAIKLYGQ
jgi:hypothetical protein